jgi:hypothetical protein
MEPNYQHYTLAELLDALENIDKEAYPERVRDIHRQIERLKASHVDGGSNTTINSLPPCSRYKIR